MNQSARPATEQDRIETLKSYCELDEESFKKSRSSGFQSSFDEIVRLACQLCDAPISSIGFMDETQFWQQAVVGVPNAALSTARNLTFCQYTVLDPDGIYVRDTRLDPRFENNPAVISGPQVRSYLGVPILTKQGIILGAICVADTKPRDLTIGQMQALKALANHVMRILELRQADRSLMQSSHDVDRYRNLVVEKGLEHVEEEKLAAFGRVAAESAHELSNLLTSVVTRLELMQETKNLSADDVGTHVSRLLESTNRLERILNKLKAFSRETFSSEPLENFAIGSLLDPLNELVGDQLVERKIELHISDHFKAAEVIANREALLQILLNLILNSADAVTDVPKKRIELRASETLTTITLSVVDSGTGINKAARSEIMKPFFTTKPAGVGTGLGLSISSDLAFQMNATLELDATSVETKFDLIFKKSA